jgi:hypothetical protein
VRRRGLVPARPESGGGSQRAPGPQRIRPFAESVLKQPQGVENSDDGIRTVRRRGLVPASPETHSEGSENPFRAEPHVRRVRPQIDERRQDQRRSVSDSAKERTRTSTGVTPLAPQASASAIPPPSRVVWGRCQLFARRATAKRRLPSKTSRRRALPGRGSKRAD